MSDVTIPPDFSVTALTGPWVIGVILGSILFGVLLVQVSLYFTHFPKDHIGIKIYVGAVVIVEVLFTSLTAVAMWDTFGNHFGNIQAILKFDWAWASMPVVSSIITSMTQLFFAWRIWRLSGSIFLCIPIIGLSLTHSILGFYFIFKDLSDTGTIPGLQKVGTFLKVWLVCAAICDLVINVIMVSILLRTAKRSGIRQTKTVLHSIAKFTVETNMITTICALVEFICYQIMPDNGYHFLLFFVLGRLYSNVLLASLNSRVYYSRKRGGYVNSADVTQTRSALWADMPVSTSEQISMQPAASLRVNVKTTKIVQGDHDMHDMRTDSGSERDVDAKATMV